MRNRPKPISTGKRAIAKPSRRSRRATAVPKPVRSAPILVPVDFSTSSRHALRQAVLLAGSLGARIVLLHVLEPLLLPGPVAPVSAPLDAARRTVEARGRLRQWAMAELPAGRLGGTVVARGIPHQEITRAAERLQANLIVMAANGQSALKQMLTGSTAERVVRFAPCSVLTYRPRHSKPKG